MLLVTYFVIKLHNLSLCIGIAVNTYKIVIQKKQETQAQTITTTWCKDPGRYDLAITPH